MHTLFPIQPLQRIRDVLMGYPVAGSYSANEQHLRRIHRTWADQSHVVGIGIACNTDSALIVYLQEEDDAQKSGLLVPGEIRTPEVGAVRIHLRKSKLPHAQSYTSAERPIRPGASISQINNEAGSVCLQVRKRVGPGSNSRFLLSCEHVLYSGFSSDENDSVVQPARQDNFAWDREDVVADRFEKGFLFENGINEIDAAIAMLRPGVDIINRPLGRIDSIRRTSDRFDTNDPIVMIGRTSGESPGMVIDASVNVSVSYRAKLGSRTLRFRDIVKCDYRCAGGDSGAPVILRDTGELIGIHIAGINGEGYFCRIEKVFSKLQIGLP